MKRCQISSGEVPKAKGPYSPAIKVGDTVYVSGQLPIDKAGELVGEDIQSQTKQCIENLEKVLSSACSRLDHVVKTTIYLQSMDDFAKVNQICALYFGHPYPARTCVEVSKLPHNALIVIDAIAVVHTHDDRIENDDCGGACFE